MRIDLKPYPNPTYEAPIIHVVATTGTLDYSHRLATSVNDPDTDTALFYNPLEKESHPISAASVINKPGTPALTDTGLSFSFTNIAVVNKEEFNINGTASANVGTYTAEITVGNGSGVLPGPNTGAVTSMVNCTSPTL